MRIIALVFAVLIATGFAAKFQSALPTFAPGNKLPMNILAEIAARITADGPLDDIFNLFDTLESQIRGEQVQHDALYERQQVECKGERSFREKEIADATNAINLATDERNANAVTLSQAQQQLETNVKSQADISGLIRDLEDARNTAEKIYRERQASYDEAIHAIEEGRAILGELYNGAASLIDLNRVTVKMFKHAVNLRATHHYVAVIGALAQVAQKADLLVDADILKRVEELFDRLLQNLREAQQNEQNAEAAAVEEYGQRRSGLEGQLNDLKTKERELRDQITNYQTEIQKANNVIAQATAKRERNQALLDGADKLCKTFEEEYKIANEQRKEELALIGKLRSVVQKKLGGVSSGVRDRATQEQNQWAAHQNVAQIDGPSTWTKTNNNYNAAGAAQAGFNRNENLERFI